MKRILGLDLGTTSIGWAVVNQDIQNESGEIVAAGSRIIPTDSSKIADYENGKSVSQTSARTKSRLTRRVYERRKLRRERLLRVLDAMNFLPEHFASQLDRYGHFKTEEAEPKIAWAPGADGHLHFLFMESFNEMMAEFRTAQPELVSQGGKIPYDWTLYYLRQKALTKPITPHELAWVLLSFNAKRGYHQLRDDEPEANEGKKEEYIAQTVVEVRDTGEKSKGKTVYELVLENGMTHTIPSVEKPDLVGRVRGFIVTTSTAKDGKKKHSLRMPADNDWTLIKKRREAEIDSSKLYLGSYIYRELLRNPKQKIIGDFVRTVDRSYYKDELMRILETQKAFIPELNDRNLYEQCTKVLYKQNDDYRQSIACHDFTYLLCNDILFYQRPLKSKKSQIDECPYESHTYQIKDENTGTVTKTEVKHVKCVAKSNPLFQEFRLWQFISNLKIYEREKVVDGKLKSNVDVTSEYIKDDAGKVELFDFLNGQKDINQDQLLGHYGFKKPKKGEEGTHRWNYVEDKTYPCCDTRAGIIAALKKKKIDSSLLEKVVDLNVDSDHENATSNLMQLWHILYSVDNKGDLVKALYRYAKKHGIPNNKEKEFVEALSAIKPYEKDYGAYSEKAIKKLLPLMRMGIYWSDKCIDASVKARIEKIANGEFDETISDRVREKCADLSGIQDCQGMPLWKACYVVYNRHSEAASVSRWTLPSDIDNYLDQFKQHSLNNPIVEAVVMETLRTVRDIWSKYGKFDEIHVELAREMKNSAEKREQISNQIKENEEARIRAKVILSEYLAPQGGSKFKLDAVRPYSPSQLELFRIYEQGALDSDKLPDVEKKIKENLSKMGTKHPTATEVDKYLAWLEQRYCSPYTGQPIPLSQLFTPEYEIEHVIPRSRYFDDSFTNKVICEKSVNGKKNNMLGMEFIKKHGGEIVSENGKQYRILTESAYIDNVKKIYRGANNAKRRKLLMEDIPDDFINRQLNDSRYISKLVKSILSSIVREDGEQEDISKNVIVCTGVMTDTLKKDWGLNDKWNELILPRFERMNHITGRTDFTTVNKQGKLIPSMPLDLQQGFNKKRIDHRHHAMDAIVIACTTRSHVNFMNNEAAMSGNRAQREALSNKLKVRTKDGDGNKQRAFKKPWDTFPVDAKHALEEIVVSFKQNLRVLTKTRNNCQYINPETHKKEYKKQVKGDGWALRKSLHKDTVFGEINLRRIKGVTLKVAMVNVKAIVDKDLKGKLKQLLNLGYNEKQIRQYFVDNKEVWSDVNLNKIAVYYFTKETNIRLFATRKSLDTSFNEKKIRSSVADTGIQKILLRHLEANGMDAEKAFNQEGIENMNKNILALNDGHKHQPIYKVRIYETADKFAIGQKGNRSKKFVEAAKGTNLFFAVYEGIDIDETTGEKIAKRDYATIPLSAAVERGKLHEIPAPENLDGLKLRYILSPNDLVYVPTEDELKSKTIVKPLRKDRIYKFVSCTEKEAYFAPQTLATVIYSKKKEFAEDFCAPGVDVVADELGGGSKLSKTKRVLIFNGTNDSGLENSAIRDIFIPIKCNRIGEFELDENGLL